MRILSLPSEILVLGRAPWFPYAVVEWKGKNEPLVKAEQQARRDAAAAIKSLYKLFKLADPTQEPPPNVTCVVSLCIDSRIADHRIHWRHVEPDGTISYQAEIIKSALFGEEETIFAFRSTVLKALDWARGERLSAIRSALSKIKPITPSPECEFPQPSFLYFPSVVQTARRFGNYPVHRKSLPRSSNRLSQTR